MLRLGTKMRAALEELTSSGCPAPTRHPRTSRTAGRQDTRYARGTSRSCGRPVRGGSAAARDRAHAAGVRVLGARRAVRAVRHRALYEDYPLVHECSDECEAVIRGGPRETRSPCAGGCGAGEEEGEESGLEELEEVEAAIIAQPWISWGVVLATAMDTGSLVCMSFFVVVLAILCTAQGVPLNPSLYRRRVSAAGRPSELSMVIQPASVRTVLELRRNYIGALVTVDSIHRGPI
ncbi:hypothetical protein FB451DRAFT_386114 [Mycena latifolia]|nr:hypothetical protein FB451DRAFT_386114 [Mycena latifolia]